MIYQKDVEVEFKAEQSLLTETDQQARQNVEQGLKELDDNNGLNIPLLSEEGKHISYE